MGGTKPKTGGLAALLRLEKERLAREASEQESSPPESERPQTASLEDAHAYGVSPIVPTINKQEAIIPPDSAEERLSHSSAGYTDPLVNQEDSSQPRADNMGERPAQTGGGDEEFSSTKGFAPVKEDSRPAPESPLSQTRETSHPPFEQRTKYLTQDVRPDNKGIGSNKLVAKKGRAKSHPGKQYKFISTDLSSELQTFVDRWKPFLTETQLRICVYIYANSTALGLEYCFTSTPKLMSIVSKTERQVKTVLDQLITLDFINRGETVVNAPREKRGTFYKLNLDKS